MSGCPKPAARHKNTFDFNQLFASGQQDKLDLIPKLYHVTTKSFVCINLHY